MSKRDYKEWLLKQVKTLSEQLKDGRYDEIDLSAIEQEASDMAKNFGQVIESLESAGQKMGLDSHDLPKITEHLTHISETTEKGVMEVINTAESIMEETSKAQESLDHVNEQLPDNEDLKNEVQAVSGMMANVQDNCFSIITSLEFEDANRQLMEKILSRLNELYDNLLKILLMLKLKDRLDKKDSAFLESLKHIVDIEGATRQDQEKIDEFFETFDL